MIEYKYGNQFNGILNFGQYISDEDKKRIVDLGKTVPDVLSSLSYSNYTNGSICENNEVLGSLTLNYRVSLGNMDNVHIDYNSFLNVGVNSGNKPELNHIWFDYQPKDCSNYNIYAGYKIAPFMMMEPVTKYNPVLATHELSGSDVALGWTSSPGFGLKYRTDDYKNGNEGFFGGLNIVVTAGSRTSDNFGLFGHNSAHTFSAQIGKGKKNENHISANIFYKRNNDSIIFSSQKVKSMDNDIFGIGLRYYNDERDSLPTISAGLDLGFSDAQSDGKVQSTLGYMIGLTHNNINFAIGTQGSYATSIKGESGESPSFNIELSLDFDLFDIISIKPYVYHNIMRYEVDHNLTGAGIIITSKLGQNNFKNYEFS